MVDNQSSEEDNMKKQRGVFEKVTGSGVWWVQYFDAAGRRRREKVGPKSLAIKLAERRRTDARAGVKMPENLRARPLLFSELTDAALRYSEPGEKGTNHSRMKVLVSEFGRQPAEEITPEQIEGWLQGHSEWTLATKNRYTALLKLTYRLAEKAKRIKYNPARLVRQPKENNERIRYLNQFEPPPTELEYLTPHRDEESRLRAVIQHDYPEHLPEFEIALHTGMRRKEQYGATWDKIDFFTGRLTVPRAKHGQVRHVKLNSHVKAILMMLRAQNSKGRVHDVVSPRSWFDPAVKKSGVQDFNWHALRHTFISRLVMNGVDLRTAQELAGHKSIAMTMRYAHLAPSHLDAAIEKTTSPTATTTATEQKPASDSRPVVVQ
jgi:site-specific recombinase XerD